MWKTRADELLTKYNQVDPVEHENLKKKLKLLEDNHEKRETVVKNLQASIQKLKVELEIKEKDLKITSQKLDANSKELEKQSAIVAELQDPSKNQEVIKLTERLEKIKNSSREIAAKDKSRRAQLKDQISALTAQNVDLSSQLKQKIIEHQDASKKLAELLKLYEDAKKLSGTISVPAVTIPEKIEANKPPSKAIPIVKPAVGIQPFSEHKSSDLHLIPSASTAIIPNPFISPAKSTNVFSSSTMAFPNQIATTATFENTSTQPDTAIEDTALLKVEATPKVGFSFIANPVSEVPSASTNITVMETTSPSESLKRNREIASPVEVASKRAKVEELPDTVDDDAPEEEAIDTDNDEELDSDDEVGASSSDEDMYLLINSSESSAESTTIDGLIQDAAGQAVDTLDNHSKNGVPEPELHVDDYAKQRNEPQETETTAVKSEATIPPSSNPVEAAPKTAEIKVSINRQPATESKIVINRPQTSASDLPKFSINRTPTIPTVPSTSTQDFIPVGKTTTEVKPAATPATVTVPAEEDKKALLLQKMAAFKRTHDVKPERGKKGRRGK